MNTPKIPKKNISDEELKQLKYENKFTISINQLLIVESEEFNPYEEKEFYINPIDKLIYRNTFKPSYYLTIYPEEPKVIPKSSIMAEEHIEFTETITLNEPNSSIILQYLYHISGYNKKKFSFILNWIASFFKDLSNRSQIILILYGDKTSGKEILFNDILTPLFGIDYCLKITESTLINDKHSLGLLQEKLFYNLSSISKATVDDKTTKNILENVLPTQQHFAQYLITTEIPELFYFNQNSNDYTVFHINQKVEEMYIPKWFNASNRLTKNELQKAIKNDLENFAIILKLHALEFINYELEEDDKKVMLSSLDDKLMSFVQAIKNKDLDYFQKIKEDVDLYKTLEADFHKQQIKQSNLVKYFNILYPENSFDSSRTLNNKLRKIDNDLFKTGNLKMGNGGKKYFKIPTI